MRYARPPVCGRTCHEESTDSPLECIRRHVQAASCYLEPPVTKGIEYLANKEGLSSTTRKPVVDSAGSGASTVGPESSAGTGGW